MCGNATSGSPSYEVSIHGASSGIRLVPSSFVASSFYRPSQTVIDLLADVSRHRAPRAVGLASEMMAVEILRNAQVTVGCFNHTLNCERLRTFKEILGRWKPARGIYCDDLIALAECEGQKLLFVTEVKGTTLKAGLSRSMEAKMFYQLARTCVTLKDMMPAGPFFPIAGAITVAVLHFQQKIVLNVLNVASIIGYFPDHWLYLPSADVCLNTAEET